MSSVLFVLETGLAFRSKNIDKEITHLSKYFLLLFWIMGNVHEEEVKERCQNDGLVTISQE